jgi:hypothetical protein
MAKVRALRVGLLPLHKALVDAERARYERAHGRIASPHEALRLLIDDPWFEWLHSLASLIVRIDDRLSDDAPILPEEADAYTHQVREFLHGGGDERFAQLYKRALQEVPEVVVAHGQLMKLLDEGQPDSSRR